VRIFQGLFFLVFGIGLLLTVYQSLSRGWLPFGARGFGRRLEFRREEQPVLYWFAFGAYAVAGLAAAVFAVRLLAGNAVPLPLR
jgi:hypothetical protein